MYSNILDNQIDVFYASIKNMCNTSDSMELSRLHKSALDMISEIYEYNFQRLQVFEKQRNIKKF